VSDAGLSPSPLFPVPLHRVPDALACLFPSCPPPPLCLRLFSLNFLLLNLFWLLCLQALRGFRCDIGFPFLTRRSSLGVYPLTPVSFDWLFYLRTSSPPPFTFFYLFAPKKLLRSRRPAFFFDGEHLLGLEPPPFFFVFSSLPCHPSFSVDLCPLERFMQESKLLLIFWEVFRHISGVCLAFLCLPFGVVLPSVFRFIFLLL